MTLKPTLKACQCTFFLLWGVASLLCIETATVNATAPSTEGHRRLRQLVNPTLNETNYRSEDRVFPSGVGLKRTAGIPFETRPFKMSKSEADAVIKRIYHHANEHIDIALKKSNILSSNILAKKHIERIIAEKVVALKSQPQSLPFGLAFQENVFKDWERRGITIEAAYEKLSLEHEINLGVGDSVMEVWFSFACHLKKEKYSTQFLLSKLLEHFLFEPFALFNFLVRLHSNATMSATKNLVLELIKELLERHSRLRIDIFTSLFTDQDLDTILKSPSFEVYANYVARYANEAEVKEQFLYLKEHTNPIQLAKHVAAFQNSQMDAAMAMKFKSCLIDVWHSDGYLESQVYQMLQLDVQDGKGLNEPLLDLWAEYYQQYADGTVQWSSQLLSRLKLLYSNAELANLVGTPAKTNPFYPTFKMEVLLDELLKDWMARYDLTSASVLFTELYNGVDFKDVLSTPTTCVWFEFDLKLRKRENPGLKAISLVNLEAAEVDLANKDAVEANLGNKIDAKTFLEDASYEAFLQHLLDFYHVTELNVAQLAAENIAHESLRPVATALQLALIGRWGPKEIIKVFQVLNLNFDKSAELLTNPLLEFSLDVLCFIGIDDAKTVLRTTLKEEQIINLLSLPRRDSYLQEALFNLLTDMKQWNSPEKLFQLKLQDARDTLFENPFLPFWDHFMENIHKESDTPDVENHYFAMLMIILNNGYDEPYLERLLAQVRNSDMTINSIILSQNASIAKALQEQLWEWNFKTSEEVFQLLGLDQTYYDPRLSKMYPYWLSYHANLNSKLPENRQILANDVIAKCALEVPSDLL